MWTQLRPAAVMLIAFTLITGLLYPLAMTGLATSLMPAKAQGSLIERQGVVVGSRLIGQDFKSDRYFHGRPSATTAADPEDSSKTIPLPYNASNSMGSNLGPTSKALKERLEESVAQLKAERPGTPVPVDLVTTSGSGLDPDISPDAALFQVARVARVRHLPEDRVRNLIAVQTEKPLLGLLGEPRVNVLALNLALDALTAP
jgi:K+-transporting ATPase ATPase C chain